MKNNIKKFTHFILNIFFPNKCCVCNNLISEKEICICNQCLLEMPLYPQKDTVVKERLYGSPLFADILYLYDYNHNSNFSKLIKSLKYKGFRKVADFIAISATQNIDFSKLNIDIVVAVPIEKKKINERGYNQSLEIAKKIAKKINKPYSDKIIKRLHSKSQTLLTKKDRLKNAQSAYLINNKHEENLNDKTVLLIDDILTTGSTLLSCMDQLELVGVKKVYVFVAAISI